MSHIFISYSHKDKEYVHKLHEALQNEGFDVWIDDRIDYGDKWLQAIEKNLDKCDAFIIVMSKNSYDSEMVQNEITRARDLEKQIFPLLLDGKNWLVVQSRQFVDVRDGSLPNEKFYQRLETVTPRKNKKAEREAAEKIAREKADSETAQPENQKLTKEKSDRETAEKDAHEKARLDAKRVKIQKIENEKANPIATEKHSLEKTESKHDAAPKKIEHKIVEIQSVLSRQDSEKPNFLKTFVCVFLSICINFLAMVIPSFFGIHFFTTGTMLVSVLLGPWIGALVGLISAMIWGLLSNNYSGWLSGIAIGIITGYLANKGFFKDWWKVVVVGFINFVASMLSFSFVDKYLLGLNYTISSVAYIREVAENIISILIAFAALRIFLESVLRRFPHLTNVVVKDIQPH
jgi:hypothetical protein